MSTAIKKRNLEVKIMSETIWLEPSSERTVFLQIKNTSDKDMSGLQAKISDAVKAKGYQVVTSPDKAYYWIGGQCPEGRQNGFAGVSELAEQRL